MQSLLSEYRVLDQEIYFDDAEESLKYAKNNPGSIITRITNEITSDEIEVPMRKKNHLSLKTPSMILEYLNRYIVAQNCAKETVSLAMYYHSLKMQYATNNNIQSNGPIMIIGPTGSGKTYLIQKACEHINTTFIHVDTSSMVPEGIMGYSISSLAKEILEKTEYRLNKAEHCVVFFDEIDKLFTKKDATEYGETIAYQLLRLLEGTKIQLSDTDKKKLPPGVQGELDTSKMQFILGGAFQWILDSKSEKKVNMGFNREVKENIALEITLEDLYKNDIPKELLGRMSSIVNLFKLEEEDYYNILNSEGSPLKEFIYKVEFHGDKVVVDTDTLRKIAQYSAQSKLGVRAIKQVLKVMFHDALFLAAEGAMKTHYITFDKDKLDL